MHFRVAVLSMLLCIAAPALGQFNINFGSSGVKFGVDVAAYPALERVPGHPVHYAPKVGSNYFFYDGLYWVYQGDNWYASSWYNGPWTLVDAYELPAALLRVPVRYYRNAPSYFNGWRADAAPRWGEHWGRSWEWRRRGWEQWNRATAPAAAPLPAYQKKYTGDRYPKAAQQAAIEKENYPYQPRDEFVRQRQQQRP